MKQVLFSNVVVLSGGGYYNPVSAVDDMSAFETNHKCPVGVAGTLRNWQITVATALNPTQERTFTLRKNGVNTALTITLSGAGTTAGSDVTHEVTIAAGDQLSVEQSTLFSPVSTQAYTRLEFEPSNANTTVYGSGGGGQQFDTATRYRPLLCGQTGRNNGTQAQQASLACAAGTLTRLDVRVSAAPSAGKSRTFVIYKNGTAQDGSGGTPNTTTTIADAATTASTNFSLSVAALDLFSLQCVSAGSPANAGVQHAVVFVATDALRQHITLTDDAVLSQSATQYNMAHGGCEGWGAAGRRHMGGITALALTHIHAEVSAAPGTGKSWTFTLQVDDVDTVLTTTISDTATTATFAAEDVVTILDGETFRVKVVPSGTPNGASTAKVSFAPYTVDPILGSAVFGAHTTVTATLAIAMGLDGATHIDNTPNTLTVYGDAVVTGSLTAGTGLTSTAASYLTLATDTSLSNERVLTAGSGISLTDAGAGSTLTVAASVVAGSVTETALSFSDITTANATSGQHGLLPKLSGNTAQFLRGDGTFASVAGAGSGVVNAVTVTMNHSQISGLGTTPITIVPAPGSGQAVFFVAAYSSTDFSAGVYSNPTLRIRYAGGTTDLCTAFSSFLNQAAKRGNQLPLVATGFLATEFTNKAIVVDANAAVTLGNAANQWIITILYTTMAVL